MVLNLCSGGLVLNNITYLVSEDSVTCEDLLMELPVLRLLRVDTNTPLKDKIDSLKVQTAPWTHLIRLKEGN